MDAPGVAVSNDGQKIAAAWMDMRSGKNNRDVQWTIGTKSSLAPEATVHDVLEGTQGHPAVIFDRDGTAWCAWEDARSGPNNSRIYAANSKTRKNLQISDDAEGRCGYPSLAVSGGIVGVAYESPQGASFRVIRGD